MRNLAAPVRGYLAAESGGAAALVVAALVALAWANVAPDSYTSLWETKLAISLGDHEFATDLRGWVNEGLMTLFFLVVGLEAKRELDVGELRERSRVAVPVLCGLGGMVAAAAIYLAINAGGEGASGWGAAVSTDTALALGVLALISRGRAIRLRVFLLTMVVIDDLVALLIIAIAYTEEVSLVALAVALGLFGVLVGLRFAGPWRGPAAVLVGFGIWVAMFESGIDAVIAGLAIGLVTSAYPPSRDDLERSTELARSFREQPTPELAYTARASLTSAISPNERLQFRLHPWTSLVIVPLFALANAGIAIDGDLISAAATSPVTIGIVAAYVIGKPAGILGAAWLGTRRMFGGTRLTVTFPALAAGAATAGIGFTVSLLVATLAFDGRLLEEAKIGVLATAIISPCVAFVVTRVMRLLPQDVRARQLGATADTIIDLADDVDPERDHIRGPIDAPVTLVEYGDFECPYCVEAGVIIEKLRAKLGDDLRYVFRNLPLADVHPNAQMAAEAAEAAADQERYWEMHDRLLSQDSLAPPDLYRAASDLGLDLDRFGDDLRRRRFAGRVRGRRAQRRRERRLGHADVLRQRPAPPGRLRRGEPRPRGARGRRAARDARPGALSQAQHRLAHVEPEVVERRREPVRVVVEPQRADADQAQQRGDHGRVRDDVAAAQPLRRRARLELDQHARAGGLDPRERNTAPCGTPAQPVAEGVGERTGAEQRDDRAGVRPGVAVDERACRPRGGPRLRHRPEAGATDHQRTAASGRSERRANPTPWRGRSGIPPPETRLASWPTLRSQLAANAARLPAAQATASGPAGSSASRSRASGRWIEPGTCPACHSASSRTSTSVRSPSRAARSETSIGATATCGSAVRASASATPAIASSPTARSRRASSTPAAASAAATTSSASGASAHAARVPTPRPASGRLSEPGRCAASNASAVRPSTTTAPAATSAATSGAPSGRMATRGAGARERLRATTCATFGGRAGSEASSRSANTSAEGSVSSGFARRS